MLNKLLFKLGYRPVHWTDETRGRLMEVFDYLAKEEIIKLIERETKPDLLHQLNPKNGY